MTIITCGLRILLISILVQFAILNASAQVLDAELSQFYTSEFEPTELNHDNYDRLKKTYKQYIETHGNKPGFDEEKFVYEYNYFLDRINRSGNVFYGDELSSYVNTLKDFILEQNKLNLQIHVYVTDYVELNAFTNDFGNIYINIATIAKLDSEKELLIVLAHEIGHVLLGHSRQTILFNTEINKNVDVNKDEVNFRVHSFSREKEIEADSISHSLLNGVISQQEFQQVLQKLEYSENPAYSGKVDMNLFLSSESKYHQFAKNQYDLINFLPVSHQLENDSLSTHPSIRERFEFSEKYFQKKSAQSINFSPIRNYSEIKLLASKVLLNSYLENDLFIEALDLILKLRAAQDSPWLAYRQSQIMTLLAQRKYTKNVGELIDFNLGCNDVDFIRFKQFLKEISKIDFNIICNDFHKKDKINDSDFRSNQEEWGYQFLYDNNSQIFDIDSTKDSYEYVSWNENLNATSWLLIDSIETNLNEILDSLGLLSSCYSQPRKESLLLKRFLNENSISELEKNHLKAYHVKMDRQKINIHSDLGIFIHPAEAAEIYHRGIFKKSKSFDLEKRAVLIQSDNLFFNSKNERNFSFNYKKSLKLNSRLLDLSNRYNSFSSDYSMTSSVKTSVLDNYLHKIIMTWVFENAGREGIYYSKVENEIQKYVMNRDVDYIVYRLSILNRNKGKGRKFNINYYELYFDLNSKGVVFLSKIGSKQFPDRFQIEQMVYLTELNKKK